MRFMIWERGVLLNIIGPLLTPSATFKKEQIDIVVLAQLSMSVFAFSYPDPVAEFGVKVLNSGETGFRHAGVICGPGNNEELINLL